MAKKKAQNSGKSQADDSNDTLVIENRKARFDYAIVDTVECGMILRGSEVKSVRNGQASLAEGYVRVEYGSLKGGARKEHKSAGKPDAAKAATRRSTYEPGLYLHNVNIAEYGPAGPTGSAGQHKPTRTRTLLVHQRELERLAREVQVKSHAIVPLKIYFKNGKAKLLVGIGKSKAHADKRETIAKRDAQRDIARALSRKQ